jgi:PfaD family protein
MSSRLADTVFLVSGGARGVTARCVVELAREHRSSFVLLGRTVIDRTLPFPDYTTDADLKSQIADYLREREEKPTPAAIEKIFTAVTARDEITRTLETIAGHGGRAEYLAVDVTDAIALRTALASSALGPITGIIHGAGVLSDKLIAQKTERDFGRVYGTKIHGLQAMLDCVDPDRLAYLSLFSSIAAVYGNRGQADYAAANEVLNKFAHAFKKRVPSCHTTVFDWGPWDGGMVSAPLKAVFESRGVSVMPVDVGARLFVETLSGANDAVQLIVNDASLPPPASVPAPPVRRIVRTLSDAGNPFLRDHVINGKAVLPAACAGVWMANACQQSYPGYRFFSLSDFRVLKGVVFDEGLADRYVLEVKEEAASEDEVGLSAMISSTTIDGKTRYHYSGQVQLVRRPTDRPANRDFGVTRSEALETRRPYEDGSLFHGPAFQGIRRVLHVGPRIIAIEGRLPDADAGVLGQFPALAFDPVAQDVQFQCLGLWIQDHVQAPALPLSYERYEHYSSPPAGRPFYVTAEIEDKTEHLVRGSIHLHDECGRIYARLLGADLTIGRQLNRQTEPAHQTEPAPPLPARTNSTDATAFDRKGIVRKLRRLDRACYVVRTRGHIGVSHNPHDAGDGGTELLAIIPTVAPSQLGAESFRSSHQVRYAYMAGAMAKGIASEDLVIALGREGILASFGAGGLPLERIERSIERVQQALAGRPYAFNLLHSPKKVRIEDATVDLYLKHGVRTVEASSYIELTPSIVRYRVAGLRRLPDGAISIGHRVIVKLSRVELATRFMEPAPTAILRQLLQEKRISAEQAALAEHVPMADDITVEADSGGHTDNRPLVALLPSMLKLRDEVQRQRGYPSPIRIGAAGGISTPHATLAAFVMGADYVVTGSVNQSCVEAGTSPEVKQLLAQIAMTDVAMAPESDLFEQGIRVQVVKQRTLFPMRAQKLFDCYQRYEGLDAIPEPERRQLEQQIFKDSIENIWSKTLEYMAVHKPEQIERAEDPKVKMSLLFKWYLGQSSRWATEGRNDRQLDYQIWCGPAMGAFNDWARGSYLQTPENRRAADIARVLMSEAAYLSRLNLLGMQGFATLVSQ